MTRRSTLRKDHHYQALIEICIDALLRDPLKAFRRDYVVRRAGLAAFAQQLNWGFVRDEIQDRLNCELIPVRKKFFTVENSKRRRSSPLINEVGNVYHPDLHPEKFLARGGHGARTFGYALICGENASLVRKAYLDKFATAKGIERRVDEFAACAARQDVPLVAVTTERLPS